MTPVASRTVVRVAVRVRGTVQGVGFRPFVHRLARERELAGWVRNDAEGVLLEVEGAEADVADLVRRLRSAAPPLADVLDVEATPVPTTGERGFRIVVSSRRAGAAPDAAITPDSATCDACLAELGDPADRRHRYPFVNCTHCGPRFTIVTGVPYDRPRTTMAGFPMCAECRAEYDDPADRRFHAQPIACPACGPQARLLRPDGSGVECADAVAAAAGALRGGAIVAVKGLGGYHLACRADDERAVASLRSRKHREERPFAVLVADLPGARMLVCLGATGEALLGGRERPIVLARRRADAPVAPSVAPRCTDLGLMLPYTPLHHLLVADAGGALVLTSGNVSDEPIAFDDGDALERLGPIADLLLVHDRPIATRTDDSVVRVVRDRELLLRRSRGHVPGALPLAGGGHLLGVGAEQKNAFCVARDGRAWVSHHIGDLKNTATLAALAAGAEHFQRLFGVRPQVVAHDLHPDYLSTRYAQALDDVELVGVQHHHAHLAATLAEHGVEGAAVGAIYDGTGLGADGTIWGGELLTGGAAGMERAGSLRPVALPGGERAIREPWRMACAWLVALHGEDVAPLAGIDQARWRAVARMAATGLSSPQTTSMGRFLDAAAALCGVRTAVTYEGQAAIELEGVADPACADAYAFALEGDPLVLDPGPAVDALLADLRTGVDVAVVAARVHNAVADATVEACLRIASAGGLQDAVLSGGVFANRLLAERTAAGLERAGLRVLMPERLPPGDGQIAYGQVAVAAATACA